VAGLVVAEEEPCGRVCRTVTIESSRETPGVASEPSYDRRAAKSGRESPHAEPDFLPADADDDRRAAGVAV